MLVLGRAKGQAIIIDDRVRVVVLEVRPDGQVRLGIEAPREVPVHREEVWLEEGGKAAGGSDRGLVNIWDDGRPGSKCVACGAKCYTADEIISHRCGGEHAVG